MTSSGWRWFVERLSKLRQEDWSAAVSGWVGTRDFYKSSAFLNLNLPTLRTFDFELRTFTKRRPLDPLVESGAESKCTLCLQERVVDVIW